MPSKPRRASGKATLQKRPGNRIRLPDSFGVSLKGGFSFLEREFLHRLSLHQPECLPGWGGGQARQWRRWAPWHRCTHSNRSKVHSFWEQSWGLFSEYLVSPSEDSVRSTVSIVVFPASHTIPGRKCMLNKCLVNQKMNGKNTKSYLPKCWWTILTQLILFLKDRLANNNNKKGKLRSAEKSKSLKMYLLLVLHFRGMFSPGILPWGSEEY